MAHHNATQFQEKFNKIIKQLAGQLWLSKLQETLLDPQLQQYLTPQDCSEITTYEQLFALILAKELVTPYDLTLLKQILNRHASGHSLLWAVYEAGFGQIGLNRARVNSYSESSPESSLALTESVHSTCSNGSTPSTGRCTSTSESRSPLFGKTVFKPPSGAREFKQLLRNINAQIDSREDLGALKLLCSEVLSHRQLDSINTALELFCALKRQRCVTTRKPEFLYRILQDCGRWDLSDLIDGYVYVCLKKGSTNQVPESEIDEEENDRERSFSASQTTIDRRRSYQFVRSLKLLGDELGQDDLATMKMLAVSWIPDSKLEKVNNVYEFFILLLERGKLSQDNISFLEHLLYDKLHVIRPLLEQGFGSKSKTLPNGARLATHTSYLHTLFSSDQDQLMMNYRRLLKTIGSRLTTENIRDLKYLCPDEMGSLSNVTSGLELLSLLEKWQEIEPNNVTFLLGSLEEIGRKDLCTIVVLYQNSSTTSLKKSPILIQGLSSSTLQGEPDTATHGPIQSIPSTQTTPTGSFCGGIATAHVQFLAAEVSELREKLENVQKTISEESSTETQRSELATKLLECTTRYNKELEKNGSLQEELRTQQTLITKLSEEMQQQRAAMSAMEHKMEVQELQMRAREAEVQLLQKKTEMELLERDLEIDRLKNKCDSQELISKALAKRCGKTLII